MKRQNVKLEQLISDIEVLGFRGSSKKSVEQKPAVPARVTEEMGIEQWLQVSGEPGQVVAIFIFYDIKRLVSDSI